MPVDVELRAKLSVYCLITNQTQEQATERALREMLEHVDERIKRKMDKARAVSRKLRSQ